MALTRSMLKGMNLTEEQVGAIIDAHKETVDALKEQRDGYKADAEKLADVQKELDGFKKGKDWKAEYEKLEQSFKDYKDDVASKASLAAKKEQYRSKVLDPLKINRDDADLIMAATDFGKLNLDNDGNLADVEGLTNTAKTQYKRYIPTTDTKGAPVENPPKDDNGSDAPNPRAAERAKAFMEARYGGAHTDNSKKE